MCRYYDCFYHGFGPVLDRPNHASACKQHPNCFTPGLNIIRTRGVSVCLLFGFVVIFLHRHTRFVFLAVSNQ